MPVMEESQIHYTLGSGFMYLFKGGNHNVLITFWGNCTL